MQLYVKVDENKYITQYANTPADGFQTVMIDDASATELPQFFSKMWVDGNGLVHANDLPLDEAQKDHDSQVAELNQIKADINASKSEIAEQVQTANSSITQLTTANQELDTKLASVQTANAAIDAKIAGINKLVAATQLAFATKFAQAQSTATTAPTNK